MKRLAILLVVILLGVFGCSSSEKLTDSIYFTNVYCDNYNYSNGYWEEIAVPANGVGEGWPAPGAANAQSGYVYLFPDAPLPVDELFVHFTIQMPHSWKEGTDVTPNIRFIFNTDEVGTHVRWKIAYSWANIGENFNVPAYTYGLSDAANNDSLKHQIVKFPSISGIGKKMGSILLCYLSRDSDILDDYVGTAIFVSANILYEKDTPGSTSEWVK